MVTSALRSDGATTARTGRLLVVLSFTGTSVMAIGSLVLLAIGPDRAAPGDVFAGIGGVSFVLLSLTFASVGSIVAARLPDNRVGWLFCVTGMAVAAAQLAWQYADVGLHGGSALPGAALAAAFPSSPVAGLLGLALLLFPDGRLPSRRWWSACAVLVVGMGLLAVTDMFRPGPFAVPFEDVSNPIGIPGARAALTGFGALAWPLVVIGVALATTSLVVRLRRAEGVPRQQLKLVLVAGAAAAAVATACMASWLVWPEGNLQLRMAVVGLGFAIFPAAAGVAILRYRLYDLDIVVNRTLVYGTLTIILGCAYVVTVLLLQLVLNGVAGDSGLAVAGSTLAVAALFRPARARIQDLVDRRFYRHRYDAQRTLESFAARLREQVGLDTVIAELRNAVADTMEPAHLSVWLRDPPSDRPRVGPGPRA